MNSNELQNNDKPLKTLIEHAGYTQKQFAQQTGLAYSTVKFYVARKKMPALDNAAIMCRTLGISLKDLCIAFGIDVSGIPEGHCDRGRIDKS
jgi:transcriptional regulator with XRE-family HTH domain